MNIDVSGLEWCTIVWFSQDPVAMAELVSGVDIHAVNQQVFFLPERRIAKIFVFRLIYGGTAWAYVYDPDFNWISKSSKFWQRAIDKFYDKYKGISNKHSEWIREAIGTGKLLMPTGRQYAFSPVKDRNGEFKWPRTQILNYPVQGLGHDLVTIARVSLWKRIRADEHLRNIVSFVSTVHDSIVLDLPESMDALERIVVHVRNVFNDVPSNFHRLFGVEFNLPLTAKISYGKDLLDMQPVSMV